jgi:hypothetical protein
MRYRKKPVVIEAMQFPGITLDTVDAVMAFEDWAKANKFSGRYRGAYVVIETLEGEMIASPGDWIIKGVKGEFYPCKPDIFEATYEPAEEQSNAD